MTLVTNTDVHTRHWNNLVNKGTGTTLELKPGESAEVDLPDGVKDPYLSNKTPSTKRSVSAIGPAPDVPAPAVPTPVAPVADESKE